MYQPLSSLQRYAFAALAVGGLAKAPAASDLTLNGSDAISVPLGAPTAIELVGGANLPALVLVDLDPGPTALLGDLVPLGFSPAVVPVESGFTDGGGVFAVPGVAPNGLASVGLTFHLVGAIVDSADPNGVDFSNGATLTVLANSFFRSTDLGGRSVDSYPFFHYVRAFNAGEPVELAVDPGLHPSVAGATADLYVTEARSPAEWALAPSLIDVSHDGVNTVTFSATDFSANRFAVDDGSLPNIDGAAIGVGYDLVVDVDRDGRLGPDDLIDGYSDRAGIYVVRDTTEPGPFTVIEEIYSLGGSFSSQDLYYPENVAELGQLPLVVVSHGNGHNYQWYDHIGMHLASYGFIVMSHQNNTVPGIETASTTTLNNTDNFLGNLDVIAGGALQDHVDGSKIMWIGHSRGGEGVTRAYDRILDGTFVPANYTADDIIFISSMAPTDFLGTNSANPHGKPYHLWVASADNDVSGCASSPIPQSFPLHDRAENQRSAISMHGVGHGDLHDGGGSSVASGPCLLGRTRTHNLMRGYMLPLFRHHLNAEPAAEDFLWRQWKSFQPAGATQSECAVVQYQFREGVEVGKLVIDDFQSQTSAAVASSGAAVSTTLSDFSEDNLDDGNSNFTDNASDPFNGFTYGRNSDTTRGIVFSYDGADSALTYDLAVGTRDWSSYDLLSFRASQATRHPLTLALDEDQVFHVRVTDGSGASSSISIGAYGAGLEELYPRTGCGIGTGWAAEMETFRIRLDDFRIGGTGVDLADVVRLEFLFGPGFGQAQGRIGMDDIELIRD